MIAKEFLTYVYVIPMVHSQLFCIRMTIVLYLSQIHYLALMRIVTGILRIAMILKPPRRMALLYSNRIKKPD